jgi:2-polyprenyl-3-methyl-5-hydroxy-6-metoxy-1,4-benzoquinol methylase
LENPYFRTDTREAVGEALKWMEAQCYMSNTDAQIAGDEWAEGAQRESRDQHRQRRWEKVHSERRANFVRFCEERWGRDWTRSLGLSRAKFLEIGAGAGAQVKWLVENDYDVTALECSASAIARMRGRSETWVKRGQLRAKMVDIRKYENGTSVYDCVVDVCCLQHLTVDEAVIVTQRARHWLKPGGWFFSKQVMKNHGLSRTSYMRTATLDSINQMFRGYKPVKIDICNEVVRGDVPLLHAIVTARVPV